MKTLLVLGAVIAMAACGGTPPAQLAECEAVADDAVAVANDIVEENGDLSADEFIAKAVEPDAGRPVELTDELESRLADLNDRATATGCSDEDFAKLYRERADQVEGEGFLADLFRKGFERGESPAGLSG